MTRDNLPTIDQDRASWHLPGGRIDVRPDPNHPECLMVYGIADGGITHNDRVVIMSESANVFRVRIARTGE